ncbi:exported protein of unknown function [Tenacibaculum sp. 190524A02b]|uniref:hypothetical protein n=1 Tax=Tenacibaculum vairaonense TaxID=3137860 RepID=UPI0032B155DE
MKKVIVGAVALVACFTMNAQDLVSGGSNSWIFHTPDNGRTSMHIAPKTNGSWDWSKEIKFENNGTVSALNLISRVDLTVGGFLKAKNDIIFEGGNDWIIHTPGDNPGSLHFAPKIDGDWSWGKQVYFTKDADVIVDGKIGIGTRNPLRKLDIESSDFIVSRITRTTSGGGVVSEAVNGNGESWRYGVGGGVNSKFSIYQSTKSFGEGFLIDSEGNIGIGSKSPDSKLTVNGTIHSKEVRVDLQIPADYVFEKYYEGASTLKADYKMPTLEEVEAFTKKNHHLPAIPSAAKIQEEGLHLKEMTNLLLQKIEELTLYTIEQEKRIKTLEKKLATK